VAARDDRGHPAARLTFATPNDATVEILYLLVPLSIGIAFAIVAALAWSVWNGQFDDLERQAGRMLDLGDTPGTPETRETPEAGPVDRT
jgi:cbb3-type cytochrome oxidase maturation protein